MMTPAMGVGGGGKAYPSESGDMSSRCINIRRIVPRERNSRYYQI